MTLKCFFHPWDPNLVDFCAELDVVGIRVCGFYIRRLPIGGLKLHRFFLKASLQLHKRTSATMPAPIQSAMTSPSPTITPNHAPPHPDLACLPRRAVGQNRSSEDSGGCCKNSINHCSTRSKLKLNTKIGLHTPHHHPPQTFKALPGYLGS